VVALLLLATALTLLLGFMGAALGERIEHRPHTAGAHSAQLVHATFHHVRLRHRVTEPAPTAAPANPNYPALRRTTRLEHGRGTDG
jgi:hypothetical protein